MAPVVLDKIVHTNISGVREAIEQHEAQPEQKAITLEQAEELFWECLAAANLIEWSWNTLQEAIQEGTVAEGRILACHLSRILKEIEEALRAYAKFREIVTASYPNSALPFALSKLDRAAEDVKQKKQQFASLLAWLDTPLPFIDIAKLPKGERTPTAEGYEDGAQFLARLQSGGEL